MHRHVVILSESRRIRGDVRPLTFCWFAAGDSYCPGILPRVRLPGSGTLGEDLLAVGVTGYGGVREDRIDFAVAQSRKQPAVPQHLP